MVIDEATEQSVLRRLDALTEKPRGVTDAVPAYASLAVHYDCTEISRSEVERGSMRPRAARMMEGRRNVVEIPVLCDGEDLEAAGEIAGEWTTSRRSIQSRSTVNAFWASRPTLVPWWFERAAGSLG